MKPSYTRGLLWLVAFSAAFAGGFLLAWNVRNDSGNSNAHPVRQKSAYQFIEPLLGCAIDENTEATKYLPLQSKIEKLIDQFKTTKQASSVAVYFRDLDSGRWMGVNESEKYALASLYKVALMMAYLKKADTNPSLLNQSVLFEKSIETGTPDYPQMEIGKSYTVNELLERLIVNSDNDAKDLLHDHIDQSYVDSVFTDLGLEPPQADERGDSMSPKQYSAFFRILFNGTYLSKDNSEKALELLGESSFKDGLVAGIPENTKIAHKFGNRVFAGGEIENGVTNELHDCGIIYATGHPYFLCVMTKGYAIPDLEHAIAAISKTVFDNSTAQ